MTLTNSNGVDDIVGYYRMLERRLARLERGTQGSSGGDDPVVIATLAIGGLALSTQTVIGADDSYRVMMRYSWTAVPNDPSEYNKDPLDGYLTSWSINGVNYTAERFTTQTNIDVGPFIQGQSVTFRVRARTKKGTLGAFSSITNSTTTDATAPFQSSTPTMLPYLGQLKITWNGLDVSANPTPTDFRFAEVHLSTASSTFTPTVATLIGTILRGGGTWIATDLAYGTTYYCRLVLVDTVGNKSPASTAASAVPEQIVNGDMGANSIATANIQNLAVNNAKIADMSVGKLTAGSLTADMTVSARIKTANTGARVELNTNGIQAFNSSGSTTVSISAATGSAVFVGSYFSDFSGSGTPYLTMQDAADRTTIYFVSAAGTSNYAYINSPADGLGSPQLGLNTGSFTYLTHDSKHRLFMNNASGIRLETNRITGGAQVGYGMFLHEDQARIDRQSSTGGDTGGKLILSDNNFFLYRVGAGVQNGGQLYSDTTRLILSAIASGTTNSELILEDNDSVSLRGRFVADFTGGGKSAIYTGRWAVVNLSGGGVVSYGVTMATTPRVLFMCQTTAGAPGTQWVWAESTTSFEMRTSVSLNVNATYWVIRHI